MAVRTGPIDDHTAWQRHGFRVGGSETSDLVSVESELNAAGSLPKAWVQNWITNPLSPAIATVGSSWLSGQDLLEQTANVAHRFHQLGVAPGDRILMSAPPSTELVIAHIAALRLGAIVVPVNTAYTVTEVEAVAAQGRPTLAIIDDPRRLPRSLRHLSVSELATRTNTGDTGVPLDASITTDPAMLMFTSGTTGKPKGVVLSHGNILASAEALRIAWHWTPEDRLILSLPLFHMHGLGVGIHGTLLAGSSVVIVPKFDVGGVLDEARDSSASLLFGVPTMWVRFAESSRVAELARLRLCVSGSAPLAPDVFRALSQLGQQTILERYGMTETVMNVSNPYIGERRAGSVGLALPGVQVRLAGEATPGSDEVASEILLKGPNIMRTYWENPGATAAAFDNEGWFLTGDIGTFDSDGYLSIVGRSKDLIITGGFNVYPREVEEALVLHPAVAECAVVGVADAQWGETVLAYVVASESVSEQTILEHAAVHLARFKQPRAVRFIDALPRNALGKVVKSELQK